MTVFVAINIMNPSLSTTSELAELAQNQASHRDFVSASQNYEKILRSDPKNIRALTALGHCYLLKGEYQKSYNAYSRALRLWILSTDPQLWFGIGLLYTKVGSPLAERALLNVLRVDPEFVLKHEVLFKLGKLYVRQRDPRAVSFLQSCLLTPSLPIFRCVDVICLIGKTHQYAGSIDLALSSYKEALALDTENCKTMEYLAWALHLAHKDLEAIDVLNRALSSLE